VLQEKKYSVHEGTSKRYHHLAQFPNKLMSSVVNIKKKRNQSGGVWEQSIFNVL
jgi:hypothetical protein